MNRRLTTILLIALIVSAGATWVLYRLVGERLSNAARPKTTQVLLASHDLEIGAIIRDADVRSGEWIGAPPKGAIAKRELAVGRGVVSALYEGEPVLDSRLAAAGSGGGLAATIPPGLRAAAVKVDEVVGVAGFVVPGMRVDVIISGKPPGQQRETDTLVKTLLQNIQVLSAGTNIQKDAEGKPVKVQVVNLLVNPEQAEALSLASAETRIQLVLRNPLDTQIAQTQGSAVARLFKDGKEPPQPVRAARPRVPIVKAAAIAPAPAPTMRIIEIFNGSKRSEARFAEESKQ